MRTYWLVTIVVLAALAGGCETETSTTSTEPTTAGAGSGSATEGSPPPSSPPASPPPSPPPSSGCCGGQGIHCASGSYRGGYSASIPQFRGDRGFVLYSISGISLEGKQQKYGVLFVSDGLGFGGDNWIYVKGIDTFPGRSVGAWKIEAEGQGVVTEGGYTGSISFR